MAVISGNNLKVFYFAQNLKSLSKRKNISVI